MSLGEDKGPVLFLSLYLSPLFDMAKVNPSDIDGETLFITTQKTNDRLPIDLNNNAPVH